MAIDEGGVAVRARGDVSVEVDKLPLRWAPPAVVDELWPNDRFDRALDGAPAFV